jgi:hypothetical protein
LVEKTSELNETMQNGLSAVEENINTTHENLECEISGLRAEIDTRLTTTQNDITRILDEFDTIRSEA